MALSKSKIKDSMKEKEKGFESISHLHSENANRLETIKCDRCKYDRAEQSLKDKIASLTNSSKTSFTNPSTGATGTKTLKELRVIRGKFDDVIGWSMIWQ